MTTTLPNIDYDLDQLSQDLVTLMSQLSDRRQREIQWIESAWSQVSYKDEATTSDVKERTKKFGSALCVLYFMVVVEEYFPNIYRDQNDKKRNLWEEARKYGWLWESELHILRAYRHVRHSFAHSPDGEHANQNRSSFDRVAESNHPLPLITSNGTKITVEYGASILMADKLHNIIANIISRLNSSPRFKAKPAQ